MKNFRNQKNKTELFKSILVSICLFALFIFIMVKGIIEIEKLSIMQNIDLARQNIKRGVIQCYAIEGRYPPNIEYIEENYGVKIDHDKYFVIYDCFASNLMPLIEVYEGG